MFEVGGTYSNRIGTYTVLDIGPEKMKVRYENGVEGELRIAVQERIWQNILTEMEARSNRSRRRSSGTQVQHFIKSVASLGDDELNVSDIRAIVTPMSKKAPPLKSGDRFIYYSVSAKAFFAVATITGEPKEADAKDFPDLEFEDEFVDVYPIDIDAFAATMSQALWLDNVELESQPRFKELLIKGEIYLPISEDDFELLAESLTEYVEAEEDEDDELDEDLEEEEEELLLEDDLDI